MTNSRTSDRDVDRVIRSWLHEDRHEDVSRIAGAVLDQVEATPQRRSTWWPARRTPVMNKIVAIGLGAAAVVAVLLIGSNLLGSDSNPPGGAPSAPVEPSEAAPSVEPSAPAGGLPEGPHALTDTSGGGVGITVTIAAPLWDGDSNAGYLCWGDPDDICAGPPDGAASLVFAGVTEYFVYGDPCHWSSTLPDAPATTVDEIVSGLANQATRDASAPEDITLDGYSGKKITLHVPDDADFATCDEGYFGSFGTEAESTPARYHQGPGQIDEVWIVDVDGHIVLMDGAYHAGTEQSVVEELRAIIQSATFELP